MPPSKKKRNLARQDASEQLHNAAHQGAGAVVARLLAVGTDPNALVQANGPTPGEVVQTTALITAVGNGRLEVARLLVEGGADPSLADGDGGTPL